MRPAAALVATLLAASSATAGFFKVTQVDGKWWLLDNEGKPFLARAVNCVDVGSAPDKFDPRNPGYCALKFYPSEPAWAAATAKRLKGWGFNTIGGYSDDDVVRGQGLPYTVALVMGGWFGLPWADVRDPASIAKLDEVAAAECAKYRDDPLCIGYFTDNELGWWDETAFLYWMGRPSTERLKGVLWGMLREEYRGDLRALLRDFEIEPRPKTFEDLKGELSAVRWAPGRRPVVAERFTEALAGDYYETVCKAVRKADPNHLVLGDRYLSFYSQPVARAAARHLDVVSTNYNTYAQSGWIHRSYFDSLHRITGKPIMVTEYYFSAMENRSGDRNRNGPFMVVDTQARREAGARAMTELLLRLPYIVGVHWFQFADEPPEGRGDGEDFNFGLVDTVDRPYEGLTAAFTDVFSRADAVHREGPKPEGLVFAEGAWKAPRAGWTRSIDGRLDEWDLPATWVKGPQSRKPFEPFADFHLAWSPEGLLVGLVFLDFGDGGSAPAVSLDLERMTVVVRRPGAAALEVTLRGIHERVGSEPKAGPDGKKPEDARPFAPLVPLAAAGSVVPRRVAGVRGEQSHSSVTTIAEAFVPASALGGADLKPGEKLRVGLSIRLRGDVKETYWPVSLAKTPAASSLAVVELADTLR